MGYDDRYDPDTDFDRWYTRGTATAIARWIEPAQSVLELGCATGAMTEAIVACGASVTAVDRSEAYLDRARARVAKGVEFLHADIAELALGRTFDHVVAANVAHEVPDLASFLAVCRDHVRAGGYVHVSLQNPRSLHRLLGRAMGLIDDLLAVSARGEAFETLRLLDADELADAGAAAGLRCVHREGVMVKPLPNDGMSSLPDEVLEGFLALAEDLPEHSAMNLLVFTR